jgi:threonine synthase
MWRYAAVLPVPFDAELTMGEGLTPLVAAPGTSALRLKLDFLMPTLSFKDRGAVVLAGLAKLLGAAPLVVDSSGNAGTAMAAYAARAGLSCEVFVPAGTSVGKLAQMQAHGATVRLVPGDRQAAADAAISRVGASPGCFYASHAYHPYFLHGTKTFAYELWEQAGGGVPSTVVVPVGNGTLLLGAYLGFGELVAAGLADRMPALVGVQAAACAPLAASCRAGTELSPTGTSATTVAEGIAIAHPPRGHQALVAVAATGGGFLTVSDDEVTQAARELAGHGLFVEPTAAVCWAAVRTARATDPGERSAVQELLCRPGVVVPLCGAGLKAVHH